MKRFFVFLGILLLLISCSPKYNDTVKRPQGVIGTEDQFCFEAQIHLQELGCKEGDVSKNGTTFEELCKYLYAAGVNVHPQCLIAINNCEQVNSCISPKDSL